MMKFRDYTSGLALLALLVVIVVPPVWADGRKTFEKNCQTCHDLPKMNETPSDEWAERLNLMAPMAGLSKAEEADVLSYLMSHSKKAGSTLSMAQERNIFEKKCTLCHSTMRVFNEDLTQESRRHVVLRMQKRASDWITPKEAEAILHYLQNSKEPVVAAMPQVGKKPVKTGMSSAEVFRTRCTACHSLERIYLKVEKGMNADAWNHVVQRMQSKNPKWLSRGDAKQIMAYLRSLQPVKNKATN